MVFKNIEKRMEIIPSNLSECFSELDKIIDSSDEKDWFKNSTEEKVVGLTHHGFGSQLRNQWKLWEKDSKMSKYFSTLGVWHADDMSGIIITSYHRHINNIKVDLKGQIEQYTNFWNEYEKENGPITHK